MVQAADATSKHDVSVSWGAIDSWHVAGLSLSAIPTQTLS
jgi:hypothetical protein